LLTTRILDQPIITNEKYNLKPSDPFRAHKVKSRTHLHIKQTRNERKSKNKTLPFHEHNKQHGSYHKETNKSNTSTKY